MNKSFKFRLNIITVAYVVVLIVFCLILYNLDCEYDYSTGQKENVRKFGVSFMTMNNPFYEVISEGIKTTVEANGDILISRNPALDVDRQIEQIQEMIDEKVDGIFICPVDYVKIVPVIKQAREKGIIIVLVDTELYDESIVDGIIVSDNYQAGVQCARCLMSKKDSAKILILEHQRVKSGKDRVNGFLDTIKKNPNYKVVKSVNAEGQLEVAMPMTDDVIENNIDFDTVFAINDLSALGALAAIKENGLLNEVDVYGVDGAPEAKAVISESLMTATAAQYPSKIGEKAVAQMYSIIRGEPYEKKILVNVDLITHDNLDKFSINSWQ